MPLAIGRILLHGICAGVLLASTLSAAHAEWLSRLTRIGAEVGGAGSKARLGVVELERAVAHLRNLPAKGAALSAHVTQEGHWKFANREGEVFTAASPQEMARVAPTLLPDAPAGQRLDLYLSEATLFADRALLADLPPAARLYVVTDKHAYPLVVRAESGGALHVAVRPNLLLETRQPALFEETVTLLERPLVRSSVRTLALEPGGPQTLAAYPRLDADTGAALVDAIDPATLADALTAVRGQTVLVTGRVDDAQLWFRPASGPEQSLRLPELTRAAADADVNLVLLNAEAPRQPGGRNWLWQRIAVGGLDEALKRATLGDFLDALGASRGPFRVGVEREAGGRIAIRAVPTGGSDALTGVVGGLWTNTLSSLTGNVVTSTVEVHARDESRQRELDTRIVPGVPAWMQIVYLICFGAGVLAWPVASAWFGSLWPPEQRSEYGNRFGFRAAQAMRLAAFLALFLPIVGLPALLASFVLQFWTLLVQFVRIVRRLAGHAETPAG